MRLKITLVFLAIVLIAAAIALYVPQSPLTRGYGEEYSVPRSENKASVQYDNKVALVIGNWKYPTKPLYNPKNDAHDIAQVLDALGFDVTQKNNLNRSDLDKAIVNFKNELKGSGVGFFYYAGHGLHVGDDNYMIPIDFEPQNLRDTGLTKRAATPVNWVMEVMKQAGSQINIVVIDACRAIPKPKTQQAHRFIGDTSEFEGLSKVNPPIGTIIGYAADVGGLAKDNETERNGLYTKYLLKHLNKPGLTIEKVFKNTATDVAMASVHKQVPWYHSSLMGEDFCLASCKTPEENRKVAEQARLVQEKEQLQRDNAELQAKLARLAQEKEAMQREQSRLQAEQERLARQRESTRISKVFRDRLADGSQGPEMVWIPAGTFRMGDLQGGGGSDEQPVHSVSVARFAMGRYEVTVGEFRRFVNATGYQTEAEKEGSCSVWVGDSSGKNWRNLGFSQNENHPVVCVSWNDATAYAEWLTQQTGKQYRLPTEAEWEYAARAGTTTSRYWGNNPDDACRYANVHDNTSKQENQGFSWTHHDCTDGYAQTAPVGRFQPNGFDLFDMLGNVWEWTCSEYQETYNGAENKCISQSGSLRALRGGAWGGKPRGVRSAGRSWGSHGYRSVTVGLRLARL